MRSASSSPTTTALDVSFLGIILTAVAFYAGKFASIPAETPELVRFRSTSTGTSSLAGMPQDSALLLLARSEGGTGGGAGLPSDPFWSLLIVVGLVLVVAGPVLLMRNA